MPNITSEDQLRAAMALAQNLGGEMRVIRDLVERAGRGDLLTELGYAEKNITRTSRKLFEAAHGESPAPTSETLASGPLDLSFDLKPTRMKISGATIMKDGRVFPIPDTEVNAAPLEETILDKGGPLDEDIEEDLLGKVDGE